MSCNRAAKSGIAAEASKKVQDKYCNDRALTAMQWVFGQVGESLPAGYDGNSDTTQHLLCDGMILARLSNVVEPGSVKASLIAKTPTMAFKKMELINLFLDTMTSKGYAKKGDMFQTVDLYESQNMNQVILGIEALGRSLVTQGRGGFGKGECHGEARHFTEQQLREGQSIIGLQMGTNKGANQSGLNMGKTRAIVD